jgi:DNA-binding winged helix-turn-helix (wHTH) protein
MDGTDHDLVRMGTCTFDAQSLTLRDGAGATLRLRSQSMRVLAELVCRRGAVVSRDVLVETVWRGIAVGDDSLVQCIKDIRKAIGDTRRQIIQTIVGEGYRLHAEPPPPAPTPKPSILIDRISCTSNSQATQDFAEDLHERLVLIMTPRSGVQVLTGGVDPLPVDYTLRGRVRVSGDRVRLFLSLSEGGLNGHLYAESFDGALSELDQLAENVARRISSVVRISIIAHHGKKYASIPNEQLDFQSLLAKAHYFYSRITVQDTLIARAAMQTAVEISPDDPKALALLAHSATEMHPLVASNTSKSESDWAMSIAERAVSVGAGSAFAFRTRANLRLWLLKDHAGCRADCARALAINPNFYLTHLTLATSDILSGSPLAGIERMNSYVCLSEIDLQYPFFQSLIGLAWILAGDAEAATKFAREAHERSPRSSWHAMVYAVAASSDPAITETEEFQAMIANLELPFEHFRSLPFSRIEDVELLEAGLRAAGVRSSDRSGF